eukprot:TRINITY_DN20631_c0_g1_i1.p1 TRINITY_DN20631_c0_g1~~TRINITY_DN20631_c0_g1_i1.p1  ORF type:complete len:132 (-),score=8.36 TRINITY_DN20631_c0_g1_i1:31-402(-)
MTQTSPDAPRAAKRPSASWYRMQFAELLTPAWRRTVEGQDPDSVKTQFEELGYILPVNSSCDHLVLFSMLPDFRFTYVAPQTKPGRHPWINALFTLPDTCTVSAPPLCRRNPPNGLQGRRGSR